MKMFKMNKKEMNKKGAEMTIGTIIIIILALVVLVILVYGFSTGWSNLWEKITGFGGGKVNVQTVIQSCQLSCTTNSQYDYCKTRNLIEADANGKAKAPIPVNCEGLEGTKYGLDACSIDCTPEQIAAVKKAKCEAIIIEATCTGDSDCKWDGTKDPKCSVK